MGAGGGFIVVPGLVLLYEMQHLEVVATSASVVALCSTAALLSFWRQGRVDQRLGGVLAVAMVPGMVVGLVLAPMLGERGFHGSFGLLLLLTAALVASGVRRVRPDEDAVAGASAVEADAGPGLWHRHFRDALGHDHRYSVDMRIAIPVSVVLGLLPSLFGVGGGMLLTPLLVVVLRLPVHVATATSQMVIVATVGLVAGSYLWLGYVRPDAFAPLALGVILGAPAGAALAQRLSGLAIVRILAVVLAVVAVELLLRSQGMSLQ